MASGSPMVVVAVACYLLAALTYSRRWQMGTWFGAAGSMILAGALAARGVRAAHWPLTSEYEFALAFALTTALATQVVRLRNVQTARVTSMLIAALWAAYARFILADFKRAIRPLQPALDSVWLPLHVGAAAFAYAALALAGAAGLAWVLREQERAEAERLLDRAIAAGFPLLTLSMILGMIWAQVAWGRYWGWDIKEVWTLITWLVYALYWHVRRRIHWQGRRLAWLAIFGLVSVVFTFLGVGWLARLVGLESLHLFD